MRKSIGFVMLLIGAAGCGFAFDVHAPEIDPSAGIAALALLSGGLLVLVARRKK